MREQERGGIYALMRVEYQIWKGAQVFHLAKLRFCFAFIHKVCKTYTRYFIGLAMIPPQLLELP